MVSVKAKLGGAVSAKAQFRSIRCMLWIAYVIKF